MDVKKIPYLRSTGFLLTVACAGALSVAAIGCNGTVEAPDSPGALEEGLSQDGRDQAETEIRALLSRQQAAWNRGDIDAFMQDYWQSEQLRFASGGEVRRGWQMTYERYKQTYPDRAAMGSLDFANLEIEVVSPDAAVVFGSWRLEREADAPNGLFTLLFERMAVEGEPRWVIVADHTSSSGT